MFTKLKVSYQQDEITTTLEYNNTGNSEIAITTILEKIIRESGCNPQTVVDRLGCTFGTYDPFSYDEEASHD